MMKPKHMKAMLPLETAQRNKKMQKIRPFALLLSLVSTICATFSLDGGFNSVISWRCAIFGWWIAI